MRAESDYVHAISPPQLLELLLSVFISHTIDLYTGASSQNDSTGLQRLWRCYHHLYNGDYLRNITIYSATDDKSPAVVG